MKGGSKRTRGRLLLAAGPCHSREKEEGAQGVGRARGSLSELPPAAKVALVLEPVHAPKPSPLKWVQSSEELRDLCARWQDCEALGVDTEFVRTRTFYPRLGLIQVGDGEVNALIDPLSIPDLDPLAAVFQNPEVVKVFHSCGEDLEVLYHGLGAVPRPLFDNQLAAAFVGLGHSLGYHRLVLELFEVDLPKGETRSNWMKRPLTESQKKYAAQDVEYLLPAWHYLAPRLEAVEREEWLVDELEALSDVERFLPSPDTVYRAFASHSFTRRELGALRLVAEWREKEARRRDLPRNFVLPKAAVVGLVRSWPRNERDLTRVKGIRREDVERHSRKLLGMLREAQRLPSAELPERPRRPLDLSPYRKQVENLRSAVAEWVEEQGLPMELVANRKSLENVARRLIRGEASLLGDEFRGWRKELLGEVIEQLRPEPRKSGGRRGKASR